MLFRDIRLRTKLIAVFLFLAAISADLGALGFYFVASVGNTGIIVGERCAPLGIAAMEIKQNATYAHLLLEEILAGDTSEDVKHVWKLLDNALWYCDAILKGGKNEKGVFYASKDRAVLGKIAEVKKDMNRFIKSAHERHRQHMKFAGVGSSLDQQFDQLYETIQDDLSTIINGHATDIAVVHLAGQAKYLLANGHLFLEEVLSGDEELSIKEIKADFSLAWEKIQVIGKKIGQNKVKGLVGRLAELRNEVNQRYTIGGRIAAAGTESDAAFDKEFRSLMVLSDKAEKIIHDSMEKGLGELKAVSSTSRRFMIGFTAFAFVAAAFLGIFTARLIAKPVAVLQDTMQRFGAGEVEERVQVMGKDEVGQLGAAFNRMAEDILNARGSLESAKEYTDNIIRSMTDTLIVVSPEGCIETVNKTTCTVLGYEEKELIGQPFGTIISKEVFRGTKLAELVEKGSIVNMDVTYRTKEGRKIPMSFTGSAMRDKEGKLTGIVATARDMRDIQELIAELRTSRAYSESIVTTIPSGLAALDEKGRVLSTNPGFATLFKEKEPLGKRLYDLVPSLELKNVINKVLIEGGESNLEISQDLGEGSIIILNISVSGLRIAEDGEDREKKPLSAGEKEQRAKVLVVFDDITERKRLTRELEQSIEDLKRTQAQLVQSGKLSALGELAAGVAHEINNPLSGVLTYAILLKEKLERSSEAIRAQLPEFPKQLDMIKMAAERCKAISDNLLSFSRQSETDMSSVDISDVISKTFELIGVQIRHKRVKLNREIQNDLPAIQGNANQLQQVFTNIVLNAVYVIDQEGEITVCARREDSTCEISISDTGPGIPQEHLDRIFDPFFTTKPIGKGTGLGLSIAYGIIQNHGGEITVDSLLGRGTTFRIKLPVKEGGKCNPVSQKSPRFS